MSRMFLEIDTKQVCGLLEVDAIDGEVDDLVWISSDELNIHDSFCMYEDHLGGLLDYLLDLHRNKKLPKKYYASSDDPYGLEFHHD